jgi:hypothetical protein
MNRREWMASVAGMAIGSRVQPDKRMSRFRSTCNKAREYAKLLGPSVGDQLLHAHLDRLAAAWMAWETSRPGAIDALERLVASSYRV